MRDTITDYVKVVAITDYVKVVALRATMYAIVEGVEL